MNDLINHTSTSTNENNIDMKHLLCPFCHIRIPFITYELSNKTVILNIECNCSINDQAIQLDKYLDVIDKLPHESNNCILPLHNSRKAYNYCGSCLHWICQECLKTHQMINNSHPIFKKEIHMGCIEHNNPYDSYCINCTKEICLKCQNDHVNHRQIKLHKSNLKKEFFNSLNLTKEIMNKNKENLNQMSILVDKRIDELNKMKEDLQFSYQINEKINLELEKLLSFIISTSELTKYYSNYAMHKLIEHIHINDSSPSIDFKTISIKQAFRVLKSHYENNFILKMKESIDKLSNKSLNETSSESLNKSENDSFFYNELINDQNKIYQQIIYSNLTTLTGHTNTVKRLIQLREGLLASASWDGNIKIWNVSSSQEIATLKGHSSYIWCIIQLKDLSIMSCSEDSKIIIWDHMTYQSIKIIQGDRFRCIIQLSNGNICTCSSDKTITIWDMKTFHPKMSVIGHTAVIWCVIQLVSHRIVSCSYDSTIKIWNSKLENIASLKGHNGSVNGILQLKDGRLASCSDDKSIRLWDIKSMKQVNILSGHQDWVYCIIQLNNKKLVSGSHDHSMRIWCLYTYNCIDSILCDCDILSLVELSDETLVCGCGDWNGKGEDCVIKVWSSSSSSNNSKID